MAADKVEETDKKVTEQLSESAEEAAPLTRKRTRDDFEEEDKKDDTENSTTERKIAQIKRRKDVVEGSEEKPTQSNGEAVKTSEDTSEETTKDEPEKEIEKKEETEEIKKSDDKPEESSKPEEQETKEESKEEPKKEAEPIEKPKEEEKKPEKPKFVFGSTTPFGANAFSLVDKKKNVFDSASESPKPSGSTTPSVFGSNSKFGNAFQSAITKKNIFDKTPEEHAKEKEDVEKSRETTPSITGNLYKQVDLEKKDIKSGEEGEEQVYTCRAKLYALDLAKVAEGWKERGIGNVHVNKALNDDKKSRIIMRSIGLLKVILNTPLVSGLEVNKGMPSSLASEKFIRITIVEDGKPMQYALKTGNPETTSELFDAIDKLIPKDV